MDCSARDPLVFDVSVWHPSEKTVEMARPEEVAYHSRQSVEAGGAFLYMDKSGGRTQAAYTYPKYSQ